MTLEHNQFRLLPSVDELLHSSHGKELVVAFSHTLVVNALRNSLEQARSDIHAGMRRPNTEALIAHAEISLRQQQGPYLRSLINATGVIINTNLGRAPLSQDALLAVQEVASGYSNLEYNLELGARGSRHTHISTLLQDLTGAEAALVTNNNASAVLLGLSALAMDCEVVISRGQLVEIGGGFRIPDVMRQSGCALVEVGTTNRTRIADYAAAITARTAVLLAVHPSNFLVVGFTETSSTREMAELAHAHGLLVMDDIGSGCLLPCERYGLTHEPTPKESLAAGADVVCFSGDKLLGGPQAGILVGKKEIIDRLARHPLMRAVRVDKMTLAALEATLRHYQRGQAELHIPVWRMISARPERLTQRVANWTRQLAVHGIIGHRQHGASTIGGGSLPGETLPTTLLALHAADQTLSLDLISQNLRLLPTPIIARIAHDCLLLDPRTILPEQDESIVPSILTACQHA
jgi:L-seryl-tRNA(Ser) seleniumtransferase